MKFHLAQINVGRTRGPMDSPVMAEFAAALDEINALAEASPGFVWRFKTDNGNATEVKAYEDPLMLVNLSVWESVESLRNYAYRSAHGKFFARRAEWFESSAEAPFALWWIPAGQIPTVEEAVARLAELRARGPGPRAFTFKQPFPPDGA